MYPNKILTIDFETSGLSAMYDYPTSLSAAIFDRGEFTGDFINLKMLPPENARLGLEALRVQGIDLLHDGAEGLKKLFPSDAVTIKDAMTQFVEWSYRTNAFECPNVAHNAVFDWSFWDAKLATFKTCYKVPPVSPIWICTKVMAQRAFPDWKGFRLDLLLKGLEIEGRADTSAHNSLEDCILLGQAYFKLKAILEGGAK